MNNELQILEGTSHPNIMRVYELLHDEKFYFIISEFIRHGELYEVIVNRAKSPEGALTESEVKIVVK
jgi:calcium-dependent protein kinase